MNRRVLAAAVSLLLTGCYLFATAPRSGAREPTASEHRLQWTSTAHDATDVVVTADRTLQAADLAAPLPPADAASSDGPAGWLLVLGILCAGAALFLGGLTLFTADGRHQRLARLGSAVTRRASTTTLDDVRTRVTAAADGVL